jgi:hypothetical protein
MSMSGEKYLHLGRTGQQDSSRKSFQKMQGWDHVAALTVGKPVTGDSALKRGVTVMSMIMARETRASKWSAPERDDRVGGLVPRWLAHTLLVVALLLLVAIPLALSIPALTTPSERVVVVPGTITLDGGGSGPVAR